MWRIGIFHQRMTAQTIPTKTETTAAAATDPFPATTEESTDDLPF